MSGAASLRETSVFAWGKVFSVALVLLSCREQSEKETRGASQVEPRASAAPTRVRRAVPTNHFDCGQLRPPPATENSAAPETIELVPPGAGKRVFFSKTGVVVTFDREEFLRAARCMKLAKAIDYVEKETGQADESALMDAFELSYVVAALLDAGRGGVRPEDEQAPRKSIVRDGWAADGCNGHCRSFGRLYRLSEDDASFFLRITDQTRDRAQ